MASTLENLDARMQRSIYLITYSQLDEAICPTRDRFAEMVCSAWLQVTKSEVIQWVVSREAHQNEGSHYHMAVKLNKRYRWLSVRNYLQDTYGIRVNFSDIHGNYYSAYRYVTKEDAGHIKSPNHPDLANAVHTENASRTKSSKRKSTEKVGRSKRLKPYDVSKLIREKGLKTRLELMALATAQESDGKTDLIEYITNRGSKHVNELLSLSSELSGAQEKYERSTKTRLEILSEHLNEPCEPECDEQWLTAAIEIMNRNEIMISAFAGSLFNALKDGRGKYRNIFIHGPANCGKTFILSPLKVIYKAFVNPASGSFAWVGAETAEVILLNDFRWSSAVITWESFLTMLEGDTMHLPAPKSFMQQDILFDRDTPIFATADAPICLIKGGSVETINTEMMRARWRHFEFWRQIPESEQKRIKPCGRCFADFILNYKSNENTARV